MHLKFTHFPNVFFSILYTSLTFMLIHCRHKSTAVKWKNSIDMKLHSQKLCFLPKSSIFWDITLCSPLKVNQRFRGTCHLHLRGRRKSLLATCFTPVSFSAYSLTMKMEATCSCELSADFQWTTWCHIPEDRTLHDHQYENLKSYMFPSSSLNMLSWYTYMVIWNYAISDYHSNELSSINAA
jgi:hypothetical protein